MAALLEIKGLRTWFHTRAGIVKSVDDLWLDVNPGEIRGIVGESGSGKSVSGLSVMGLVESPGRIESGEILFEGRDLLNTDASEMRKLRGNEIAMIFQDPMMSLNPVLRIGTHMAETLKAHRKMSGEEVTNRSLDALAAVGIPDRVSALRAFPHQFSGGMRQRVAIALALLNDPKLIIADEPTTALDVTIQSQIISLVQKVVRERNTGLIWVTHDVALLAGLADTVSVMYGGRVIESGRMADIIATPAHPYTRGLLASVPTRSTRGTRLIQIQGQPPLPLDLPPGCVFAPRCDRRSELCVEWPVPSVVGAADHLVACHHPHRATAGQRKEETVV